MKYYIQGSPTNADKIKAAFERLGVHAGGYDFSRIDVLFFTFEVKDKTYMMSAVLGTGLDNIILTHQDYKELELSAEPKFKVGDLVYCDGVLGRVSDINNEQNEVTLGGSWTVYLDENVTIRKADHRDEVRILRGGQ